MDRINQEEMLNKIENVRTGRSKSEVFNIIRPPEDFGDAVELYYNDQKQCFRAVVFDPQTKTVFSEQNIDTEEEVSSFITKTVK